MSWKTPLQYDIQTQVLAKSVNEERLFETLVMTGVPTIGVDVEPETQTLNIHFQSLVDNITKEKIDTLVLSHIPVQKTPIDEVGRQWVRAGSLDDHDVAYFTSVGDKWEPMAGDILTAVDESRMVFQCQHTELRNLAIKLDGITADQDTWEYDATEYDQFYNKVERFSEGLVTFNSPIPEEVEVSADYVYAVIGGDEENSLVFDFNGSQDDQKVIYMGFCDTTHIQGGTVMYTGGELDSSATVCVVAPPGVPYPNNNGEIKVSGSETVLHTYVRQQILFGDVPSGVDMEADNRSGPLPVGLVLKFVIKKGSSTNLKGCIRLYVNRQRTQINI